MAKSPAINMALLKALAENQFLYVGSADRHALIGAHSPALIEQNETMPDPNDSDKVATRITDEGRAYLDSIANKGDVVNTVATSTTYAVISGVALPPIKRGGGGHGAPRKYNFDGLNVGDSFFVPATADSPEPVKTLAGAVSGANMRYANEVGTKTVTRKKRDGRKIAVDEAGEPIMETVEVPTYEFTRKFVIRSVEKGVAYGEWVAPENGAIVYREK